MKKKILILTTMLMLMITGAAYAYIGFINCGICNTPMHWNGNTHMEWGKFFHVYECMNGHTTLVRVQ